MLPTLTDKSPPPTTVYSGERRTVPAADLANVITESTASPSAIGPARRHVHPAIVNSNINPYLNVQQRRGVDYLLVGFTTTISTVQLKDIKHVKYNLRKKGAYYEFQIEFYDKKNIGGVNKCNLKDIKCEINEYT